MTTVIAFILMFGLLVFVHEFGHFYVAKKTGMLVREFAIGFGPKVFSTVKNETLYTIRLLPMGGYVRVAGEDPEIIDIKPGQHIGLTFNNDGEVKEIIVNNKEKHPDAFVIEVEHIDLDHALTIQGYEINEDEKYSFRVNRKASFIMDEKATQIAPYDRQFSSKTVGQRGLQLFAGPFMNFVLSIVIFLVLANIQGVPVKEMQVGAVADNSPAQEAGFQADDKVIEIEGQSISKWEDFQEIVQESPNETLEMIVLRGEQQVPLEVTPALIESPEGDFGQVGVIQATEKSFVRSIPYSLEETYRWSTMILTNLGKLITGQFSIDVLSGPVGIYDATDQIVKTGFMNFLMWTAALSVNLGIINLLPLPALDGGRLLFVGLEAVRGKPIDPQKEGVVHFIGFALLMLLMIIVTWNDIQRLFL
ncbi:RIP metalloprotease RseP [Gracilibacillus thailandensis]|uniref:Zinc metalloprotease n=1 Tax=Gracilibacillus thailandensis TaxID=563735 RepID=A0A6N7QWU0_9BACI|nr:RIP metalloprotease RseP [Gracilibacillus thailandensis]MRI65431.1 RIP metalloprotease RseP [Gracilibacillus thailandensis]